MSIVMSGRSSDPKDNLKMKPSKGILKSSSSFEAPDAPSSSRKTPRNKETTFDEMNILETLHPPGKDYGHMKIDEPKTPYERDVPDSIAVDPEDLAKRIKEEKENPSKRKEESIEEDSEEEPDSPEAREEKKQFEMKRKAHYNEFLMAKKMLQELKDDDEED